MRIKRFTPAALTAALLALPSVGALAATDILACAAKAKEAVGPKDALDCQTSETGFNSTLALLYAEGWHLVETEFFNGNRQILYFEKEKAAP